MKPLRIGAKLLLAFGFMLVFLESAIAAVKWWRGDALMWWEWGLAGALPVLVGLYLRYFSIFGCKQAQCLLPRNDQR